MQVGWEAIAAFLGSCQSPDGGFGGGPQQLPHLAPTYAALAALTELGLPVALAVVDRRGVAAFIERMAVPSEQGGGFRVCDGALSDNPHRGFWGLRPCALPWRPRQWPA